MDRRWLAWFLYVVCTTTLLVLPGRFQAELPLGEFVLTNKVLIAKGVHISAYAAFAVLTGWLHVPLRFRPALMLLLMFHAAATEFIQLHVPNRGGSLGDVLWNHLGIAIGFCISWKWWSREHDSKPRDERSDSRG